jgi:hypothetical protein
MKHVPRLFEHCKVGKSTLGETIRIQENCESAWTKFMTKKRARYVSAVPNQSRSEAKQFLSRIFASIALIE